MRINRRAFLGSSAVAAIGASACKQAPPAPAAVAAPANAAPPSIAALKSMTGDVKPITPRDPSCKIPHMGWNTLDARRPHPLLADIPLGEKGLHAYFVHSYHLDARQPSDVIATTEHGQSVTAFVGRDNFAGTQFHPEKSQALGLSLISNFLRWRP